MKYLKNYNESLRDLMTPKSEEEILKSLKISNIDNTDLLIKSLDNNFLAGIKIALENEIKILNVNFFKQKIFNLTNTDVIKFIINNNKLCYILDADDKYILEKYKLGLHQDEEKNYEIWFKEMLTDLDISKSTINSNIITYTKNNNVLYYYDKKNNEFWYKHIKIWLVFNSRFNLNSYNINMLTKYMVEKYLNLNNIKTYSII
jgi:hypothetical protein